MRKLLVLLLIVFMNSISAIAQDKCVFNVENNKTYILLIADSASNIEISNPEILKTSPVVTLDSDKQQILVRTLNQGTTDMVITTPSETYNYQFNVGAATKESYDNLLELDLPYPEENN